MIYAIDPRRLVFLRTNARPTPRWRPFTDGRVAQRERGCTKKRRANNWGKNITLLASITKEEGMGPCLTVEGATTKEVFETYNIEQGLAPTLRDGQEVVVRWTT